MYAACFDRDLIRCRDGATTPDKHIVSGCGATKLTGVEDRVGCVEEARSPLTITHPMCSMAAEDASTPGGGCAG